MENATLLDDVVSLSIPSTSMMTPLLNDIELLNSEVGNGMMDSTDDPFPSPADPFEDSHYYVNITDVVSMEPPGNGTTEGFNLKDVLDFFDDNTWLIYLAILIGVLIVLNIVVGICIWIYKHKKRLINQSDDPMLSSNYEQGIRWKNVFCCCCCGSEKREAVTTMEHRQNSASNLESYGRRDPLPAKAYRSADHQEHQELPKAIRDDLPIDNSHLAMYIDGIKDVPTTYIPTSEYRELPPLRVPKTNVYQNY